MATLKESLSKGLTAINVKTSGLQSLLRPATVSDSSETRKFFSGIWTSVSTMYLSPGNASRSSCFLVVEESITAESEQSTEEDISAVDEETLRKAQARKFIFLVTVVWAVVIAAFLNKRSVCGVQIPNHDFILFHIYSTVLS